MKNKRLVGLVALMSLCLVGCGDKTSDTTKPGSEEKPTETSKPAEKETIVIGSPSTALTFIKAQAEAYLTANNLADKYTITTYELSEGEADSAVKDWSAKASPDIYAFASDKIANLKQAGALSPVPEAYSDTFVESMGEVSGKSTFLGDTAYAYPYSGDNGYFLYYNKDLVPADKVGSVEDIVSACTANNVKFAYNLQEETFFGIGALMTFGARYNVTLKTDGSFNAATSDFNSNKGYKGGKAVYNLLHNEGVVTEKAGSRDLLPTMANKIGAIVEGSWKYDAYKNGVKDNGKVTTPGLGDKLGLCKLPTITVDGETANCSSFLGYKFYGVNPMKSSNKVDRLTVLHGMANYFISEKVQEARFDALTVVPTNEKVKAMSKVADSELVKALADQSAYSVPQTVVPGGVWEGAKTCLASLLESDGTDDSIKTIMDTFADAIANSK